MIVNDKELELLNAVGNCYNACHENFEETLNMISGWRGYTSEEVKDILTEVKDKYSQDPEYIKLRKRFPRDFPI